MPTLPSTFRKIFTFPAAGRHAPAVVQALIRAFRDLPVGDRAKEPLLYAILGSGTPPYKFAPDEVRYTDGPTPVKSRTCSNCLHAYRHVTTGIFICDQVRGAIQPPGWCDRWAAPMSRSLYTRYQQGGE